MCPLPAHTLTWVLSRPLTTVYPSPHFSNLLLHSSPRSPKSKAPCQSWKCSRSSALHVLYSTCARGRSRRGGEQLAHSHKSQKPVPDKARGAPVSSAPPPPAPTRCPSTICLQADPFPFLWPCLPSPVLPPSTRPLLSLPHRCLHHHQTEAAFCRAGGVLHGGRPGSCHSPRPRAAC